MEWNETVRDGMPLYYETRERERRTFPWRFVGGGGDGGGLAFMVAFFFLSFRVGMM